MMAREVTWLKAIPMAIADGLTDGKSVIHC